MHVMAVADDLLVSPSLGRWFGNIHSSETLVCVYLWASGHAVRHTNGQSWHQASLRRKRQRRRKLRSQRVKRCHSMLGLLASHVLHCKQSHRAQKHLSNRFNVLPWSCEQERLGVDAQSQTCAGIVSIHGWMPSY
eukprot:990797-Amphidinium_carterae.1